MAFYSSKLAAFWVILVAAFSHVQGISDQTAIDIATFLAEAGRKTVELSADNLSRGAKENL